jgi:predicted MPP superfamily phosphohydrolase
MSLSWLLGLSAALHLYIGARLVPSLPDGWAPPSLALLLAASALCMPLGLIARRVARQPLADRLAWAGLLFMGLFSSLFVLTFLRDGLLAAAWIVNSVATGTLPSLQVPSAQLVPPLALAITVLGFINARRTAAIVRLDVPIRGLPQALHGFSIAQISDIHVGPTIKKPYLDGIVDAVNALQPDMVAITGDLVDGTVAELAAHVAPLARLRSREGSFFVTGNHEYYSGAGPWLAELQRLGVTHLLNQHVVFQRGEALLVLAGVTDYSAGHFDRSHRSDPAAAAAGAPAGAAARVLLAHQPRSAPAAAQAGFDLQLSGHTHGGQFLPWNFFVRLQQPFTAGLHQVGAMRLYVSRGTGYWGPPKRFGAPSEITFVRLLSMSA